MIGRSIARFLRCLTASDRRSVELGKSLRDADRARDQCAFTQAAEHYRQAIDLAPERTDLKIQLANMLKDSGRFLEAEAVYFEAQNQNAQNPDIHLQLGHLYKLTGRRAAAIASYRHALALNPNLATALRELSTAGEAPEQWGIYEEAMRRGGIDSLIAIRGRLDDIAGQVQAIRASLPDAQATVAFPVEAYAEMRRLFDPPPPSAEPTDESVAIVLMADREPLEGLHRQLSAIRGQSHPRWTLHVLGADRDRRELFERAAVADPRIRWIEIAPDESPATRELAVGRAVVNDWVLLLSAGAIPHRHALAWIAATAARTACEAIIFDEELGDDGEFSHDLRPILRQAVDLDTLLQANIYGETLAVTTATLRGMPSEVGLTSVSGLRSWLLLNLVGARSVAHIPLPLIRIPANAAAQETETDRAGRDHASAVRAHLGAAPPARMEGAIAVIIPTKNNSLDASECVKSLIALAQRSEALEILVLNNGEASASDALLMDLGRNPAVTVHGLAEPFNWSRFNNIGAAMTRAPCLVFANDDMLMLTQDWDEIVRTLMSRAEIGAAGARLLYSDDTIQHAGVLFNWRGSVIHDGLHQPATATGPTQRWRLPRSVSAVTGAFLITRRSEFEAAGGFDEADLAISYSDIDYALKLRAEGLRILWTPALSLYHYESKSRGLDHLHPAKQARANAERRLIEHRWPGVFDMEPSVNPTWYQTTLPFRLLAFPSQERIWAHIELSAQVNPWVTNSQVTGQ